jgi:hypothetical protein
MFYIYGAENSKATDKAENLLLACHQQYKIFLIGKHYTVNQLLRLHPETKQIPHVYHGLSYIGGLKELYDHLYELTKLDNDEDDT